jgi:hypothetical protein
MVSVIDGITRMHGSQGHTRLCGELIGKLPESPEIIACDITGAIITKQGPEDQA